jgi:hypothetical protein
LRGVFEKILAFFYLVTFPSTPPSKKAKHIKSAALIITAVDGSIGFYNNMMIFH